MVDDKRIDTSAFVNFMKKAQTPEAKRDLKMFMVGFIIGGVLTLLFTTLI